MKVTKITINIPVNASQFVTVLLTGDFYKMHGKKQYAYYQWIAEDEHEEKLAVIEMPLDLSFADMVGTIGHEISRFVDDYFQTQKATLQGNMETEFWREYEQN